MRPFTFVFDDPRWVPKVLVGGVFVLCSFFLIGSFFLLGYFARLVRNVLAGVERPLPEWDDLGEYFSEGVLLFGVVLLYVLPIIVLVLIMFVPAAIMSSVDHDAARDVGSGIFSCVGCLIAPIALAIWLFLPAALLMTITTRRFGAAFEFRELWAFIKANIGNYLLAIVVTIVARFIGQAGVILLCVGVLFTEFWALCASGYAFAQVYKQRK